MEIIESIQSIISFIRPKLVEFWNHPVKNTIRIVALVIAIMVALSFLGDLINVDKIIYFDDWVDRFILLLLAWILVNSDISKIAIGIFLLFVFMMSITFLIVPIDKIVETISSSIQSDERQAVQIQNSLDDIQNAIFNGGLGIRSSKFSQSDEQLRWASKNLEFAQMEFGKINTKIKTILDDYDPDPEEKLLYNLLEAIVFFLSTGAPFIFTMLMGALGSSIVITRQFIINYTAQSPVWYIYRLTQGTVMALLIIYGLSAGMLSLGTSEPIQIDKFNEIKYFIGFISALSGLFSEQAFTKLNEISKTLFGQMRAAGEHLVEKSKTKESGRSGKKKHRK